MFDLCPLGSSKLGKLVASLRAVTENVDMTKHVLLTFSRGEKNKNCLMATVTEKEGGKPLGKPFVFGFSRREWSGNITVLSSVHALVALGNALAAITKRMEGSKIALDMALLKSHVGLRFGDEKQKEIPIGNFSGKEFEKKPEETPTVYEAKPTVQLPQKNSNGKPGKKNGNGNKCEAKQKEKKPDAEEKLQLTGKKFSAKARAQRRATELAEAKKPVPRPRQRCLKPKVAPAAPPAVPEGGSAEEAVDQPKLPLGVSGFDPYDVR